MAAWREVVRRRNLATLAKRRVWRSCADQVDRVGFERDRNRQPEVEPELVATDAETAHAVVIVELPDGGPCGLEEQVIKPAGRVGKCSLERSSAIHWG
jgi:hypothetical protein